MYTTTKRVVFLLITLKYNNILLVKFDKPIQIC